MTRSITILKSAFAKLGGAEKYARLLANAFHEKGCFVRVLTTEIPTQDYPYEVTSFQSKSKTSVSKLWDFEAFCERELRSKPTDIVFGMDRNRFQTHLRAGSGSHKSYLEHRKSYEPKYKRFRHLINPLHTSLLHIEKRGFEHPALKTLFTNSHLVKNEILTQYDVDPSKISVIHNGVEWEDFKDDYLQIPENDKFEFLFIGSDFERKGLRPLLENLPKGAHLTVVGYDKHQKQFEKISPNATFVGAQKNIRPFLQKADCLVIPSYYDPFANVTTEALAMGLFVVSSKTNGGSEVLTEETGAVIETLFNPDAIRTALQTALKHKKTPESATKIRNSIKHLDFSTQLQPYLETCLST